MCHLSPNPETINFTLACVAISVSNEQKASFPISGRVRIGQVQKQKNEGG